ncbi:hypothetical protein RJ639_029014 [Escallonia herrerae]|uniref:Pentatricopeptide repeat-containing protein n=1 Tax=Escallonia herrerae TaxID=1293975 RepID=A0AA88XBU8_9ASTE|nr:hypothetical protein RJ639_029014 [Escallonia herrerae]
MATMTHPILPFRPQPQSHPQSLPTPFTPPTTTALHHYTHLLSSISISTSLLHLKQVHAQILRHRLDRSNSLLLTLLLSSFPHNAAYAVALFHQLHRPETHLSNRFLRELSRSSQPGKTLSVFERMRREGLGVDRFSFPSLLKASARVSGLSEGTELHGLATKMGFDSDPFVQTALVGMYAACGEIRDARQVYCQSGLFDDVLPLFEEMKSSNIEPDEKMFSTVLSACGRAANLDFGKAIHEIATEKNVAVDSHLQSVLVTMYAGCGSMDVAQTLFAKLTPKNVVASTAMVNGYSKVGQVEAARLIFNQMVEKDLVCWSAMISGYAESDQPQEALKLFNEMQVSGLKPDQVTMLSVISACAQLDKFHPNKTKHHT